MSVTLDRNIDAVIDEAAEWVVRMGAPEVTLEERSEFVAWLKRSPVHLQEYLRIEGTWAQLSRLDPQQQVKVSAPVELPNNVVGIKDSSSQEHRAPQRHHWRLLSGLAAMLVLALGAGLWLQNRPQTHYTTATGEQRTFKLSDGSTLTLNTRTNLRIDFSDTLREVHLLEGEALFKVAKDARRPFRVSSDRAVAQAIGTVFAVRKHAERTVVTVLEGQVAVAHPAEMGSGPPTHIPAAAVRLAAGARADVADEVIQTSATDNPGAPLAWQSRRLIFQGETLAEAVAEFNRYNEIQLVLRDDHLSKERISGVFDADQPQALVRFLERSKLIKTVQTTQQRIVLSGDVAR